MGSPGVRSARAVAGNEPVVRQPWGIGAVAGLVALTAGVAPAAGAAPASLGLEDLFERFRIDGRSVGYVALDAATGAVLTARNPDGAFVPASAIKAATAIMALEVLGPAHRAVTRLYTSGAVEGGVLNGDLILVGGGDPELYTEHYLPMIRALKAQGIRRIGGRFLFDDSLFPESRTVNAAHDRDVSYNAGIGALSLNFNRLRLSWQRYGKSLQVRIDSRTDKLSVPVDIVTAGVAPAGTQAPRGVVRVAGGTPRWTVVPTAKRSGAMWVPVKRVGLMAAHVFQQLAAKRGIVLPDPARGALPAGAAVVAVHRSEPLIEAVRHFLKYSNNVATEIVGLATTRRMAGKPLDLAQSGRAMADWWRRQLPDGDWTGLRIANHSGLSRETRISPRQMAVFLRWARNRAYAGRRLWDLLQPYRAGTGTGRKRTARRQPQAGERPAPPSAQGSGSRTGGKDRGAGARPGPARTAAMQVRGKTGTLNHARSLAGYMVTRSKREVVFAVFLDDGRARRAAVEAGRRYRQLKPARWAWRSRVVLNGIVRKIMLEF
ncbi:MAG: D-alanyl-D-alanine carboxypeptidase/D-alanyl-D-alanine-endopeptidase [Rhodospirillaceae bacterium]|nr:D-alanyl-D-alanine carboxypeptidase/D-alanyl-D-alanine-endopeptidase [Rhodospirillaceae bacterium]